MSTAAPMRPAPWTFAAPWGARGYVSDLDGHTPQLEVPDTAIGTVRDWLGRTTSSTR
jgi:hypothetical protein